jgi:hypothetical protein
VRGKAMHGVLVFVPATEVHHRHQTNITIITNHYQTAKTQVLDAEGYMAQAKLCVDAARARGLQCLVVLSLVDKIDAGVGVRPGSVFQVMLTCVLVSIQTTCSLFVSFLFLCCRGV